MARQHHTTVTNAKGGCGRCNAQWDGKNAVAMAARHHDNTRHPTWAEQTQRTEYGGGGSSTKRGSGQENLL